MIINLRISPTKTIPIRAHRVLKKKYPKLELYAHYGVAENGSTYQTDWYCISTKSGFGIADFNYRTLYGAIKNTINRIDKVGEEKAIEIEKAVAKRYSNGT